MTKKKKPEPDEAATPPANPGDIGNNEANDGGVAPLPGDAGAEKHDENLAGDREADQAAEQAGRDELAERVRAMESRQMAMPMPSRGRIVDFLAPDGDEVTSAMVTKVQDVEGVRSMNLCSFDPVFGPRNYFVQNVAEAARDAGALEAGCWAWPVRV